MNKATVIIPAYNAGGYLSAAVASALDQNWDHLEVIVVDDGSTDHSVDTIDRIGDPRLRVMRQENLGKAAAMNRAISAATGHYYCILDADDEMHRDRVERQVSVLEACPDLAAVFCGHELLIADRRVAPRLRAKNRAECRADIEAMRMPAHDPTGMYRMTKVRDMAYEPSLRIGQGYDYILRVGERWPMVVIGECLYGYRISQCSATTSRVFAREQAVREVLRRACERRKIPFEQAMIPHWQRRRSSNRIADNGISTHCLESVVDLRAHGRWIDALRVGIFSAMLHPLDWQYYRAGVAASLPDTVLKLLRRSTCVKWS